MAALIAFYSRAGENYFGGAYRRLTVGNTERAAKLLAELTGGALYKIEQAQPYSDEYQTCIAEAKADLQRNARPEVLNLPDDLDIYDEIYLGYPNYWGTMPRRSTPFWNNTILPARPSIPSAPMRAAVFLIPCRTFKKPHSAQRSRRDLPFRAAA